MSGQLSSDRRAFLAWCAGSLLGRQPWRSSAFASTATTRGAHALALVGVPALGLDFDHLPYVNPEAPKGGRLRLGILGAFENLNRFNIKFLRAPLYLVGAVYEPLMTRSQDEPKTLYGLIANYVDLDHAKQRVTFHLDARARFSDGAAVLAEDVLFTFELLKAKGPPLQRSAYSLVKSADKLDSRTINFDLAGVDDRELPLALASMPVLPTHATDVERFENALLTPPLASGPYIVSEIRAMLDFG